MRWAELDSNGIVTNTIEADEEFAQEQGYTVQLPDRVGKDWSTPDGGITWVEPPPDPSAVGLANATAGIASLLADQVGFGAQIQADAELFASTAPGTPMTQDHLDAFRRMVGGFATVMQAVTDHMVLTRVIPPETTASMERIVPLPLSNEEEAS